MPTTTLQAVARSDDGSAAAPGRDQLISRYLDLQPHLQRRFNLLLHRELREDLQKVTLHQLNVLIALRIGSVSMRELSKELEVSESSTTAVVDRLVRQGLVVRLDDPSDRRVVRLTLSDAGAELVARLHETKQRHTASLLAVLDDDQLAQFVSIMETLARAAAEPAAASSASAAHHEIPMGSSDDHD